MKPRYSFVVPIFNEEEVLPAFYDRMRALLAQLDSESEVILINDGSRDRSAVWMNQARRLDARFKLLHLSRNFGHQAAITAGMDFASGDALIIMDADLQDPPEVALEMIAKWKEGFEIVYGQRIDRQGESFFKRMTAALFYRIFARFNRCGHAPRCRRFQVGGSQGPRCFSLDARDEPLCAGNVGMDWV